MASTGVATDERRMETGCAADVADVADAPRERRTEGARARFGVDEAASNTAMRCLATEKSLRKSTQSGLCDAKSDASPESFF
jgi:hypothetical protein